MKLHSPFLRRPVARRTLPLFVFPAPLSLTFLAVVSLNRAKALCYEEGQMQRDDKSKATGMGIFGRLQFVQTETKMPELRK